MYIRDVFVVFISGQGQSRISTAHRKSLQYIYSHFACYDWVNLLINKHFSYQPAYPFGEWYLSIFLIDSTENVGAHQLTHRVESSRPTVCTVYLYYILEGWHRANTAVTPPKPTQRMSKDNHRPRNRILLYTINWALNLIFECAMLRLVYLFSLSLYVCVWVVCLFICRAIEHLKQTLRAWTALLPNFTWPSSTFDTHLFNSHLTEGCLHTEIKRKGWHFVCVCGN